MESECQAENMVAIVTADDFLVSHFLTKFCLSKQQLNQKEPPRDFRLTRNDHDHDGDDHVRNGRDHGGRIHSGRAHGGDHDDGDHVLINDLFQNITPAL